MYPASELLGYSREELIGKHVLTLYAPTPNGREKAARLQEQAQAGTPIRGEELEMMKKDGHYVWVSLAVLLIYDEKGQIIERRGIVQDISERKRMERELIKQHELLNQILQSSEDAIYVKDRQGRLLLINPAGVAAIGKPIEDILGKNGYSNFRAYDRSKTDDFRFTSNRSG